MVVMLEEWPTERDWIAAKRRAFVTAGKDAKRPPSDEWKKKILFAKHSPIRRLLFAFYIECPYWVSVHLCRHVHAQAYVQSQRNDRQSEYDRNTAPQNEPVCMIWDMSAEELMNIANKRLCYKASPETRLIVQEMCRQVIELLPEFKDVLVPNCVACGGLCKEMQPCGKMKSANMGESK